MFEPNENLASLHSYCTRNENVDFRGLFLLGKENPKFMGVKLPDFVIFYFDLWLLQGAEVQEGPLPRRQFQRPWRRNKSLFLHRRCGHLSE